jgi:hypothetical protein
MTHPSKKNKKERKKETPFSSSIAFAFFACIASYNITLQG